MLGIINKALQSYVCDIFDVQNWRDLCANTQLSAEHYEPMLNYPDAETETLIKAICTLCNRQRDDVLEDFGNYVVSQHSSPEVRKLLRLGGETFVDFLYSLEHLQERISVLLPDMELPNLRLEAAGDKQYILHYANKKKGLGAVLLGILYAMASSYETLVVITHTRGKEKTSDTDFFSIDVVRENWAEHPHTLPSAIPNRLPPRGVGGNANQADDGGVCQIPLAALDNFMPMYMIVGSDGAITTMGRTLAKLIGGGQGQGGEQEVLGGDFFELFTFKRPIDLNSITDFPRATGCKKITLQTRAAPHHHLVGLITMMPDNSYLMNLSLGLGLTQTLRDNTLNNKDFAPTDLAIDTMYFLEGQALLTKAKNALTVQLDGDARRARRAAYYDPLTNLHNRRSLSSTVARLIAREPQTVFSALLVDLDYFKRINDTLGHVVGDEVLKQVARRLSDEVRHDDMVARLGGDEFFLLLRGFEEPLELKTFACRVINRLSMPYYIENRPCQLSASIGSCMVSGAGLGEFDGVMERIDIALYEAKNGGRGRVKMYADSPAGAVIEGERLTING